MNTDAEGKWRLLLSVWKESVVSRYENDAERWNDLGLPDANLLAAKHIDDSGIVQLESRYGNFIDSSILAFYRVTDGWPIWLGESLSAIRSSKELGLYKDIFPDSCGIAIKNAPKRRFRDKAGEFNSSAEDILSSLLLSSHDAREVVLNFSTGETCLYSFDSQIIFSDFYEFMEYQLNSVLEFLDDMLS